MASLARGTGPVIEALAERGVQVGRRFPALPKHLRVTLGTRPRWKPSSGRSAPWSADRTAGAGSTDQEAGSPPRPS